MIFLLINLLNKQFKYKIEDKFHVILHYKNHKEHLLECFSFQSKKGLWMLVKIVLLKLDLKVLFLVNLKKSLDGNFMDHKEIYK